MPTSTNLQRGAHRDERAPRPAPAPDPGSARAAWAALAAVTLLALALRLFRLGYQSLWFDEILSWISAQGTPWHVMTQREENTNIPPLYYLVANAVLPLRQWLGLEASLRLPSVVAGVATIPIFYAVVRRWLGTGAGLVAASVVAVAPFHVWYSQEARPYALLTFLTVAAVACLQRALDDPERPGWKAAFALFAAATFWCHTVGLAFVAFSAAYVVLEASRQATAERPGGLWSALRQFRWRPWVLTFATVAVLSIPPVWRLASLPPTAYGGPERRPSPVQVVYTFWAYAVGFSFGPSLGELHEPDRAAAVLRHAATVAPVGIAVVSLFAVGVRALWRRDRRVFVLVALWLLLPLGFVVAGSLLTVHPFNVRYVIVAFLPAAVLLAEGLRALEPALLRAVAVAGALAVTTASLSGYYFDPRYARDDNRGACAFFATHAKPGELVLAHRPFNAASLRLYAPSVATRVLPFPPDQRPREAAAIDSALASAVGDSERVWLYLSRGTPVEEGAIVAWLDARFRREHTFSSSGVRLLGYVRDDARNGAADRH
jgi:mannosyltransferase